MGTTMGFSYANFFVDFIEELIFEQYSGPKPELFGRYIDDCFGATSCSKPDLESFIYYVNSFHPSLDFTREISETSVTFLDISVSITANYLSTSVHYKPTDSHSYLQYSSSHPKHTLNSILFSQFLRLKRLCKEDNDFLTNVLRCALFSLTDSTRQLLVDRAIHKVFSIITALTPKARAASDRIPFTIAFHPVSNSSKPIVNRNLNLLNSDSSTSNIFSDVRFSLKERSQSSHFFLFKEHCLSIKNLALFVVPTNDV